MLAPDTPKRKLILAFTAANLLVAAIALALWASKPEQPPQIQGVLLPQSKSLDSFTLVDHHSLPFSNEQLKGSWHLVSYGFTTCPDICPTTLSTLSSVVKQLTGPSGGVLAAAPVNVLFYTVDHRRDTPRQLESYVPFFDKSFIGLTHFDDSANPHLGFEKSLGIFALLTPSEETGEEPFSTNYDVSHGVTLFLINPEGKLQAIFEPGEDAHGNKVFKAEQLVRDYLAIRQYLG